MDDQERILNKCWQMPSTDSNLIYTSDKRAQQMHEGETQEKDTPILEFQEFLNTEGSSDSTDTKINLTEDEEARINQLTKELVQVFSPDNLDKTSESQKKELILRVLKLGGENYSSENLRRDLLKIQMEDMKATFIKQSGILNHIMEENNTENQEQITESKIDIVHTAEDNIGQLGICMSQEGPKFPCFGKTKGKRGRKSLKELRESESLNKDQQKIDQLFYNGKGKHLPAQV